MKIHLISSGKQTKEQLIQVLAKVHSYADYIHLREKSWRARDFLDVIARLTELGVQKQKIIINDRVDVACIAGVGGVQLSTHSLPAADVKRHYPNLQIGCSVHGSEEAMQKEQAGADYLLFGHVFQTASKPGLTPKGLCGLEEVLSKVTIPVIAIGGIKPGHLEQIKVSGAKGIALLSGVLLADDVTASAKVYSQALKGGI